MPCFGRSVFTYPGSPAVIMKFHGNITTFLCTLISEKHDEYFRRPKHIRLATVSLLAMYQFGPNKVTDVNA